MAVSITILNYVLRATGLSSFPHRELEYKESRRVEHPPSLPGSHLRDFSFVSVTANSFS